MTSSTPGSPVSPDAAPAAALPGSGPPMPEGLPEGFCCPSCGYDVRGLPAPRCPECGFDLQRLGPSPTRLPWAYRRGLGAVRAFWRTMWCIVRRPRLLTEELERPQSHADAQRFRYVLLAHWYVAALLIAALPIVEAMLTGGPGTDFWWIWGSVVGVTLLWLLALPGLASYFFHPRRVPVERQNRAIALSYYAWAPSAPAILIGPLAWIVFGLGSAGGAAGDGGVVAGLIVGVGVLVTTAVIGNARLHALLRTGAGCSAASATARLLAFYFFALVLLPVIALLPAGVLFLAVVYYSFQ